MTKYNGKDKVGAGIYFCPSELSFKVYDKEGVLPGGMWVRYVKVPTVTMLVVGPVLGAAYVMFLPALGFIMALWAMGEWTRKRLNPTALQTWASTPIPLIEKWREKLNAA